MGTKYPGITISGYNTLAPPDDGSTGTNNQVTWAGQKTKLADPIKTLAESMNSALVTALDFSGRTVVINDSATSNDHMKTIECGATLTETLPDCATVGAGYTVNLKNTGSGVVTVILANGAQFLDNVPNGTTTIASGAGQTFKVNSAANGYITIANYTASTLGVSSVRQTVLGGPYDVNGNPAYLPQTVTGLNLTTLNIGANAAISASVTTPIASPGVVNWTGHTLAINQAISFTGTLPTGLSVGTIYYVISAGFGANSFEVAANLGGTAINFTVSAGSGITCYAGYKNPLTVSAMNGFTGTAGESNLIGQSTTNLTWTGLTNTATNYLYVLVSNGGLTTGFTTLAPVIQSASITTPSVTSGQITVNFAEGKTYLGNGATAPVTPLVLLGSATASGGNITVTTTSGPTAAPLGIKQVFTATGTWVKPYWCNGNETVEVEIWGGGGGPCGSTNTCGGGGGAYNQRRFLLSQLNATETVTVGIGGTTNNVGGTTSFGTSPYMYAYGGGSYAGGSPIGGQGGGTRSAGSSGGTGGLGYSQMTATAASADSTGPDSGGGGGSSANGGGSYWGGGGGGSNATGFNGGFSTFGGGGGAGNTGTGGSSLYGGKGGNSGASGTAPGGGAGSGGSGARGECRVTIYRVT